MEIVYFSIGLSIIFVFSLAIVYWLKQNFSKTLLDIPNDRSTHTQPTPLHTPARLHPHFITQLVTMLALAALPDSHPGGTAFATGARRSRMLSLLIGAIRGAIDDTDSALYRAESLTVSAGSIDSDADPTAPGAAQLVLVVGWSNRRAGAP